LEYIKVKCLQGNTVSSKIFRSTFLITIGSLIFFSVISFLLIKDLIERTSYSQNEIISDLFTEIITQDVLVGSNYEVHKKCLRAMANDHITSIDVIQNYTKICSSDRDIHGTEEIRKTIYYDGNRTEKAAEIIFYFPRTALTKLLGVYRNLLFIFIITTLLVIYVISNLLSKRISDPIQNLNNDMNLATFQSNDNYLQKHDEPSGITELDLLRQKFMALMKEITEYQSKQISISKKEAIAEKNIQIAHDIRSPLEALKSLEKEIRELPEKSRNMIALSISRIEEIALDLLKSNKSSHGVANDGSSVGLLNLIIKMIIEKNLEYQSKNQKISIVPIFTEDSISYFSSINKIALKNIISNLINNGVESATKDGVVITISLSTKDGFNTILISDNGSGIPRDIQNSIFEKGFTSKEKGNGLGLYNAKKIIESSGGKINFTTAANLGTTFEISLPRAVENQTFIGYIDIDRYNKIIILDDDRSFHEVWKNILSKFSGKTEFYSSLEPLFLKYNVLDEQALFLCDFDLRNSNYNGIDVIKKFNHLEDSILVTSRDEDSCLIGQCKSLGIKLLSKYLVNHIQFHRNIKKAHIVLIDDDKLMHISWQMFCKKKGLSLSCFYSVKEFLAQSENFSKDTDIYVDSNLGDKLKGEIESKVIFDQGFTELYLTTGYDKNSFDRPAWIRKVFSKNPKDFLI
jgi:signal transduction histidine kinase/FixJ family two-component response regulator